MASSSNWYNPYHMEDGGLFDETVQRAVREMCQIMMKTLPFVGGPTCADRWKGEAEDGQFTEKQ